MALSDLYNPRQQSISDMFGANRLGVQPQWQNPGLSGGASPFYSSNYNQQYNGALPDFVQGAGGAPSKNLAPSYSTNGLNLNLTQVADPRQLGFAKPRQYSPGSYGTDPALNMTINAAGSGGMSRGVQAFLGQGFQPWAVGSSPGMDGSSAGYENDANLQWQQLENLGRGIGFDTSGYGTQNKPLEQMFNDMNNYTKDYYGVAGLQGWGGNQQGKAGQNSGARTLYKDDGQGQLRPVSDPVFYHNVNDDKGFIGKESLAAMSLALPMFGGWAGMLGAGTGGTLSAGSGLGLTTGLSGAIGSGATNALVNAGMGALTSGSGGKGFLGSLAGSLMGAGMGSVTGSSNNLSNLFNTTNPGASTLNPMGYFNNGLKNIGLGGSPLGQATQLAGGARTLSNLFGR